MRVGHFLGQMKQKRPFSNAEMLAFASPAARIHPNPGRIKD
jgi:hypothetical protein